MAGLVRSAAALMALVALAFGVLMPLSSPARADTNYPWCAVGGEYNEIGSHCVYATRAECEASISGIGGSCEQNPNYRQKRTAPRERR